MSNYAVGKLMTTVVEVYEFYEDYRSRFLRGSITLEAWKEECIRRLRALYRFAKKVGFTPYDDTCQALLDVHSHVEWGIQWRAEGSKRLAEYMAENPDARAVTTTNGRKRPND